MIPPLRRFYSANDDVTRTVTSVGAVLDALVATPIVQGELVTDVAVSSSATLVNHKLGRSYRGWVVVDKSADVNVWSAAAPNKARFLELTADGSATISVWVF